MKRRTTTNGTATVDAVSTVAGKFPGAARCMLIATCLGMAVTTVPAEEAAKTLQERIDEALRENPGLQAKRLEHQALMENVRQAGSPPDPQLSLGFYPEPMKRYMGDQVLTASLMQMFPWFGTLGAAKDEAAAMAAMKGEALREARNQLVFEVRQNWYSLHLKKEEIQVAEENLDLLKTLENIARVRYGGGTSASPQGGSFPPPASSAPGRSDGNEGGMGGMGGGMPDPGGQPGGGFGGSGGGMGAMGGSDGVSGLADVLRVRMEIAELEDRLVSLREEQRVVSIRASRLLGRAPEHPVVPVDTLKILAPPVFASPEAVTAAFANSPRLRMLEFEKQAYESQEKMGRRMGLPMLGVGVQYERLRAADRGGAMGGDMLMPMVSVSLPIWRGKYSGAVREAALRQEAAGEARADAGLELRARFEEIRRERDDAARRMALYTAQAERAQVILNIQMSQYGAGDANIQDVLRMRQTLLEYRLQFLRAVVENNTAVARMEWLMGGEP